MTRNEKNVEALAALIARATDLAGISSDADHPWILKPVVTPEVARTIAEQISDRGVLVPSALTDDEVASLDGEWDTTEEIVQERAAVNRAALERLTKGEATEG